MILLDTNVCIALINGSSLARTRLREAWSRHEQVYLSTVAIFELAYGVAKSDPHRRKENRERLAAFCRNPFLVLPFVVGDAEAAGQIRAELKVRGTPIGAYDLLLAGQAVSNHLTLITANVGEFSRVPELKWRNWLA